MLKMLLFVLLAFTISGTTNAQPATPAEYGLQPFSINDNILGEINFYVTKDGIDRNKPLIIFLDGSGHLPLYCLAKKKDGSSEIYGTIPLPYRKLSQNYHIVFISKPGTPFCDSLNAENFEELTERYPSSKYYDEKLSLDWRVNSASKVIDYLSAILKIQGNKIFAIGYSEGAQVIPKLAFTNKRITKAVSIVGGGLNQFYDFIFQERMKAAKGLVTQAEAQKNIDRLNIIFKDIYSHPAATDKFWRGHTYKRWASFCTDIPLNDMLQLNIPVLVITASNDENSPVGGLDYLPLEFERLKKTNLTYLVYTDCDHWFNNQLTHQNQKDEMFARVMEWLER